MKKILEKLGVFLLVFGGIMCFAILFFGLFMGYKTPGEMGVIGFPGFLICILVCILGIIIMIISLFFKKKKTEKRIDISSVFPRDEDDLEDSFFERNRE